MEILWKQSEGTSPWSIEQGCCNRICSDRDRAYVTRKRHHHMGFELHVIKEGAQLYEIEGQEIRLTAGSFLLIAPLCKHATVCEDGQTVKYSISFRLAEQSPLRCTGECSYRVGAVPEAVTENLRRIECERQLGAPYALGVIENRVGELIWHVWRACGWEQTDGTPLEQEEDARLAAAKQYVREHILCGCSVEELSAHCCLGKKQLNRIFRRDEGMTAAAYIRRERCAQIERLLAEPAYSLRQISEKMNFNNEYYFNAFFKKYAGMTPGAYRKTVLRFG